MRLGWPVSRIVIVGAGFGGMAAARALKGADANVTLIDRTNHHLFQPLLYQVATAALSPADIATATRALLERQANATVLMGEVTGVDTERGLVKIAGAPDVAFDQLVLATGAAYSWFGHEAWAANAPVLKSLADALNIRERLLGSLRVGREPRRHRRGPDLRGGRRRADRSGDGRRDRRTGEVDPWRGTSGVSIRQRRGSSCSKPVPACSRRFPSACRSMRRKTLESLGVEVRTGAAVDEIDAEGLAVGSERIATRNILWCAGTGGAARRGAWLAAKAARNGARRGRRGLLGSAGHPNIFGGQRGRGQHRRRRRQDPARAGLAGGQAGGRLCRRPA